MMIGAFAYAYSPMNVVSQTGDTTATGLTVSVDNSSFDRSSALSSTFVESRAANVYGGALSIYIGGYAFGYSVPSELEQLIDSSVTSGSTDASQIYFVIRKSNFSSSLAATANLGGASRGQNAYGGAISFYIGGFAWCLNNYYDCQSIVDAVVANGVAVLLHQVVTSNTSAKSVASGSIANNVDGANVYGGAVSVYVGAYSWSFNLKENSAFSRVGQTTALNIAVTIVDSKHINTSAVFENNGRFLLDRARPVCFSSPVVNLFLRLSSFLVY